MLKKPDNYYMNLALNLAMQSNPSPNPRVGAVLVNRWGKIIGKGFHRRAGLEHAEVEAINDARRKFHKIKGSTMYVTLEPCNHYGLTPPCTEAIIREGIKKIVIAMRDPNQMVDGGGMNKLRISGISVKIGVLEKEAKKLNETWLKRTMTGKPFVIVKTAMSLDGKIATKTGDSKWISCEESRKYSHWLRNSVDSIMVGIGTVLKDDPELTVRHIEGKDPLRIIIDSKLNVPLNAKVLNDNNVIIITTNKYNKKKKKELEKKNIKIIIAETKKGKVDLKSAMDELSKLKIGSVLVEGGSELNASALNEGIVDKLIVFIALKIIGGRTAKTLVGGEGISKIKDCLNLKDLSVRRIGTSIVVTTYTNKTF
ncbi:bifunctional diaminohydroxyphosphoribosylaminopyrimidine deaminase/5-amino-6-(5-phosphoribosylamino)uracil reductase RibD [Nanoarchaeota archaeon]